VPRHQSLRAAERLAEDGEAAELHRRHAHYYLALAEEAEPNLWGADQAAWFERLEAERDNLRAALRWCLLGGETELGLRLALALRSVWITRGYLHDRDLIRLLEPCRPRGRKASMPSRIRASTADYRC
jgi:predicted ATPase